MRQLCVHRDMKHTGSLESTQEALTHLSCSPNLPCASYLDERTLTHEPIVISYVITNTEYSLPFLSYCNTESLSLAHPRTKPSTCRERTTDCNQPKILGG